MSLAESEHRLAFGERAVYAMCAWDALFIPHVIGQAAKLHSRCTPARVS